jgi:hypothetical protein
MGNDRDQNNLKSNTQLGRDKFQSTSKNLGTSSVNSTYQPLEADGKNQKMQIWLVGNLTA